MISTVISWTRFCEWVQGKIAVQEQNLVDRSTVWFSDGSRATFISDFTVRFGEKSMEPPAVEITEES